MNGMEGMGRTLMLFGVILLGIGALLAFAGKIPGLGRLPGDIYIQKGNFSFYFPLATSILLSIVLSLIFTLFRR